MIDAGFYVQLGRNIRAERNRRGLSLLDVYESLKDSVDPADLRRESSLGGYESGRRRPPVAIIQALADLYGIPLACLIPGADTAVDELRRRLDDQVDENRHLSGEVQRLNGLLSMTTEWMQLARGRHPELTEFTGPVLEHHLAEAQAPA